MLRRLFEVWVERGDFKRARYAEVMVLPGFQPLAFIRACYSL